MPRHKKFDNVGLDITNNIYFNQDIPTTRRKITDIVIHCAATDYKKYYDVYDIDDWHQQRWGSGCGYHYIILLDGTIQLGRDIKYIGSHVRGYNKNSIGICYIGGVNENDQPVFDNLTNAQYESLMKLTERLLYEHYLTPEDVLGHNEYPEVQKDCPCLTMPKIREEIENF